MRETRYVDVALNSEAGLLPISERQGISPFYLEQLALLSSVWSGLPDQRWPFVRQRCQQQTAQPLAKDWAPLICRCHLLSVGGCRGGDKTPDPHALR